MSESTTGLGIKAKRSVKPARSQTRKEKINVVSKASLAMLNPAHAMGIETVSDLEDDDASAQSQAYDSVREWGAGGPASAGERTRHAFKSFAGPAAWSTTGWEQDSKAASDLMIDQMWTQSPTPELEACTMEEVFAGRSNSDDTDLSVAPGSEETLAHFSATTIPEEEASTDVTPRPSLSGRRPNDCGKPGNAHKAHGGSSLSRFFSWKRSGRAGPGKGAPPPLPRWDSSDDYPAVPQSAPATVTSFAASINGPRARPTVESLYKDPLDSWSAENTTARSVPARYVPVRATTGPISLADAASSNAVPKDIASPAGRGAGGNQPGSNACTDNRNSRWLGRKYSMPTLREVRRAQAQPQNSALQQDRLEAKLGYANGVATFGSFETRSEAPRLPSLETDSHDPFTGSDSDSSLCISGSTSTGMSASSSATSWGSGARCRISSVGRGSARRAGVDSIYAATMSPKVNKSPSLKSPRVGGGGSEFVLDDEHNQAWFGLDPPVLPVSSAGNFNATKALRRRSRSVGALTASVPPRLSQFGLPPVFTPLSDEVAAFSPLFGWDRETSLDSPASADNAAAESDIEIIDGQAVEVQTRSARRVNLNRERNGTRAVAVASPTLASRSPRLGQGPSTVSLLSSSSNSPSIPAAHSPLRSGFTVDEEKQRCTRTAANPVVVNVMPPTPDLASQAQEAFEGKPPSPEVTAGGLVEELDDADVYDGAVVLSPAEDIDRPSPRSAIASRHRDTVIFNQSTWAAVDFEDHYPPLSNLHCHDAQEASRKTILHRDALPTFPSTSDLSEFSEDAASSIDGDEGPFALARSLSTFSLNSAAFGQNGEVFSPMSSPARSTSSDLPLAGSPASVGSSAALSSLPSLVSSGLSSSSSQLSALTASSSILDLHAASDGYFAPSANDKIVQPLKHPNVTAFQSGPMPAADEEDCETPRLSGGPQQTRFASPDVLRPSPPLHTRLESPHLELDLTLPLHLDSDNINREFHAAASRQSPPRGAPRLLQSGATRAQELVKTSPTKPPKSRKRGLAIVTDAAGMPRHQQPVRGHSPITPPHTPGSDCSVSADQHAAALGFGLGLEFGAAPRKAPTSPAAAAAAAAAGQGVTAPKMQTQALRIVKRDGRDEAAEDRFNPGQYRATRRTQDALPSGKAAHEALWGELGLTGM